MRKGLLTLIVMAASMLSASAQYPLQYVKMLLKDRTTFDMRPHGLKFLGHNPRIMVFTISARM